MSESKGHLLDLKIPLGGLLSFCGLLLIIYGLVSDTAMYEKSLGVNLNLWWGLLMTIVGGVFVAAHFAKKT